MIRLGTCADGRALVYDERLYEFRLERLVTPIEQVRELDDHGHVHWLAMEQRDWFRRIDPADLDACNKRALSENGNGAYASMTPEERVQADAARDDSVLAGKIVDADPALVHAVANALEQEGLIGKGAPGRAPGIMNPLATADLPQGMEPLAQMARAQGDRKMTRSEKRLMNRILKNNDKAKARREKETDADEAAAARQREKDGKKKAREQERPGAQSQKRVSEQQSGRARMAQRNKRNDAPERAAAPTDSGPTEYYDAQGHLIAVDPGGKKAVADGEPVSPEEQALIDMRARNQQRSQELQSNDVPGMKESRRRKRDPFGR